MEKTVLNDIPLGKRSLLTSRIIYGTEIVLKYLENVPSRKKFELVLYGKVNPSVLSFWFFLGQDCAIHGNGYQLCIFLFSNAGKFKTSMD